jgi:hypothetical protein
MPRVSSLLVVFAMVVAACANGAIGAGEEPKGTDAGTTTTNPDPENRPEPDVDSPGRTTWKDKVQPLIAEKCGSCHNGARFGFAGLGPDVEVNYQKFLDLISFDSPEESRLLGKMNNTVAHAGGAVAKAGDQVFDTVLAWVREEKAARCSDCGLSATKQWLAYVESPEIHWALADDPIRTDHGLRSRAKIMVRPFDAATMTAKDAVEFLPASFCGTDGRCDFRNLAVSYQGDRLTFECRLSLDGGDWVNDVRWNVCIAEIADDGRAINPRFLMPTVHRGDSISRSDPFGIMSGGKPLKGPYDLHFQVRRRRDGTPTFSPDGTRVVLASMRPDPRTNAEAAQTYHGFEHLGHIISVKIDGSDARTVYLNEGGVADLPFFLRNGNIGFHTWNLERMDRHLYIQSTPDGASDLPVLFGRVQGPNMWGRALQLENGLVFGITGRRRSSIENYVPFVADHTLGTGNDSSVEPTTILDKTVFEQVLDFPTGYCTSPPEGPSCVISQYYADASWLPDGRALLAHNPEKTYVLHGEDMWLAYAKGTVESMRPYVPHRMGVAAMDHTGKLQRVLEPVSGTAMTSPVWIGKRRAPRRLPFKTDETIKTADLHIANVPIWFSFTHDPGAQLKNMWATRIVAVRVMVKELDQNACTNDGRPYRHAVNDGSHDHPTHLGKNNATGFTKLAVSKTAGGDEYGDVPVKSDGSVFVRVPAGKPLFFQGIDARGHVVIQRSRVFSLAPGAQRIDTSVRSDQYSAHCMSCHGTLDKSAFVGLRAIDKLPFVPLDFTTEASKLPPVDAAGAPTKKLTFADTMRPILDKKCVSCHSGNAPAGELSLEARYSKAGNFPAGKWATTPNLADAAYMASVPVDKRVPAYNYSVTFAWNMREDEAAYRMHPAYSSLIASYVPVADIAPWDPAYQNLFAHDGSRWVYLGGYLTPNFGRSDRIGGVAQDSWLVEILSGRDLDKNRGALSVDHKAFVTESELRDIISVIDVGFPFMATCDARTVPVGPNAGQPWGSPRPM